MGHPCLDLHPQGSEVGCDFFSRFEFPVAQFGVLVDIVPPFDDLAFNGLVFRFGQVLLRPQKGRQQQANKVRSVLHDGRINI